jgi:hypothetical protein
MQSGDEMAHMDHVEDVTRADVSELRRKEQTYMGSWKKRGGVGAFMMLARKWDRLENLVSGLHNYDIFAAIERDPSGADGTALAEIRDLRRYLILVEAEMISRGVIGVPRHDLVGFSQSADVEESPEILPKLPEYDGPDRLGIGSRMPSVQLMDPRPIEDGAEAQWFFIVDRERVRMWRAERLAIELNDKEHELTAPHFRGLYQWRESELKWIMLPPYRKEWGK